VKRILLFGLLAGLMTASTGCGLFQAIFCYQPCNSRTGCSACSCGDTCDDGCTTCGRRAVRSPACVASRRAVVADSDEGCDCDKPCGRASCQTCDPCADPCGSGTCGRVWHRGPLSCLFALFTPGTWCGGNCGERYWGDFYSDPPACHDPCDGSGNYTGSVGGGSGCRSCGGGSSVHTRGHASSYVDDGTPVADEGELVPQADRVVTPAAKPTGTPHKAVKPPVLQQE
jgi:hypothetical protein